MWEWNISFLEQYISTLTSSSITGLNSSILKLYPASTPNTSPCTLQIPFYFDETQKYRQKHHDFSLQRFFPQKIFPFIFFLTILTILTNFTQLPAYRTQQDSYYYLVPGNLAIILTIRLTTQSVIFISSKQH